MRNDLDAAIKAVSSVIRGKELSVKMAFCCLLARGHLLIEDLPGMGKTTLALTLSKVLGMDFKRVQFTSDMLPADVLGANIFHAPSSTFRFLKGPVFTRLLLADEINRSNPKTQSALLEAMAERQVSIEGKTYPLEAPFFVIATQNPQSQLGTFPLPESQLDRFLCRISLGYPSRETERSLLLKTGDTTDVPELSACMSPEQLLKAQGKVDGVHVSDAILDYVQRLLAATRDTEQFAYGISPRGARALMQCAKAYAFIHDRDYLLPEDIQVVLPSVFGHRLMHAIKTTDGIDEYLGKMLQALRL